MQGGHGYYEYDSVQFNLTIQMKDTNYFGVASATDYTYYAPYVSSKGTDYIYVSCAESWSSFGFDWMIIGEKA